MIHHLVFAGCLLCALALLHVIFPRYFDWDNQLKGLSDINRQMVYVHTFFIALIIALMGVLCIAAPGQLVNTGLGRKICLGLAIFWLARLFIQFFGYSASLWRGKRFETFVHVVFSVLWIYLAGVFCWIWWR